MAQYELWMTDDHGSRIANQQGETLLENFERLECTRVVNRIGWFKMILPPTFDESLIVWDNMIQVWRGAAAARLKLFRPYFIRKKRWEMTRSGERLVISGPCVNDLLRRRIVAAFAESSQASKVDFADDMMKEVVTQAIADGVAPAPDEGTRVWSDLTVASDLGNGPIITKEFAFDKLLTTSGGGVLPALAKAARITGTEVFFDIVPNVVSETGITFKFMTYTGQPGQDVTAGGILFSKEKGNLQQPSFEEDASQEINYGYGGGKGKKSEREIVQAADSTRYLASQWARCEGFFDARNQEGDGVRETARAGIERGKPVKRFSGIPVDTGDTRFGVEWDFGYKVGARYREEFNAIVRAVTLTVVQQKEVIQARLDYES